MLNIIRADVLGFCTGVSRAVALVESIAADDKVGSAVTYGPIIHNNDVIERFSNKGVPPENLIRNIKDGKVVIRAHGIPLDHRTELESRGLEIVDGTCPKVIASQKKVKKYSDLGYFIIIVGDENHGEVTSLASFADRYQIIENVQQAISIDIKDKSMVICQTTIKECEFDAVKEILLKKNSKIKVCSSICVATKDRQDSLKKLITEVDALLIIGGLSSANTKRLFRTALESGLSAWHIENYLEIPKEIYAFSTVGLTAGASTPDWVINDIENELKNSSKHV